MRFIVRSMLCTALLLTLGCGPSGPGTKIEEVAPASGTLTYQGKPLKDYRVTFQPTDGRRAASGLTDAEGKFTLGTNDPGDGAPPGTHKVSVSWAGGSLNDDGMGAPIDDPALMPKAPVRLPEKYADPEQSGITQEIPEDGATDLKINLN